MLVEDLLQKDSHHLLHTIRIDCSQFIRESNNIPIHKILPTSYNNIQRVKARLRKNVDTVSPYFNKAFEHKAVNLRQRAIFGYTTPPQLDEGMDLFYIFPINNYKFLYSKEVTNSNSDYKQVIDTLFETFDNTNKAAEIVTDILKYSYSSQNLQEGLSASAEIIFYGIPYYYAVRIDMFPDYSQLLKQLSQ